MASPSSRTDCSSGVQSIAIPGLCFIAVAVASAPAGGPEFSDAGVTLPLLGFPPPLNEDDTWPGSRWVPDGFAITKLQNSLKIQICYHQIITTHFSESLKPLNQQLFPATSDFFSPRKNPPRKFRTFLGMWDWRELWEKPISELKNRERFVQRLLVFFFLSFFFFPLFFVLSFFIFLFSLQLGELDFMLSSWENSVGSEELGKICNYIFTLITMPWYHCKGNPMGV